MPGETRMEPPMSAPPSADLRLAQAPRTYPTRRHDSLARQLGASLCLPGPSGSQPFSQEPFSGMGPWKGGPPERSWTGGAFKV